MKQYAKITAVGFLPALLLAIPAAHAEIQGIGVTGNSDCQGGGNPGQLREFSLTAKAANIDLGDGTSLLAWGYGVGGGPMQYPGPTLIVCQGDTVTVTLTNDLPDYMTNANPTSLLFPGQSGVSATGGTTGLFTQEAAPGAPGTDAVTYSFVAAEPGTYMYESGTEQSLQIEMGLVGALIIRPDTYVFGTPGGPGTTGFGGHNDRRAYNAVRTHYDREFLFFLTEMDRSLHDLVDQDLPTDLAPVSPTLWFVNGRNGPDTMHRDFAGWLPHQPYGALAQMHPSERVLMRLVGAGRDLHPFHHHGNNAWLIAQDGREFGGPQADQPDFQHAWLPANRQDRNLSLTAVSNFTIQVVPGSTYDALFTWTGAGLNWDIYGNLDGHYGGPGSATCGAPLPTEDPDSHCKDLQVVLPEQQSLTFGGLWSGSPFLGGDSSLPPGEGGLNPNLGFSYMWHSHTERELANDDVFPGGMMTMMIVENPDACLPDAATVCP